jgi:hypothetical protein
VGAIFPVLRLENHTEFAKTEGFVKYRGIAGFASGFEAKHPRAV